MFLFHCLQRQVGTTWSQVGAMKGSSSSIRWLGLRPEQLEWDTVSLRPLPESLSSRSRRYGHPGQQLLCPSLGLVSPPKHNGSHKGAPSWERPTWVT